MRKNRCTPFDPLVDTETLTFALFVNLLAFVAPPSIRLWILKQSRNLSIADAIFVAPPSIRLWILKRGKINWRTAMQYGCTPFDPLVDTETGLQYQDIVGDKGVAPPSIRLWILKQEKGLTGSLVQSCCTPFDPLVDTETVYLTFYLRKKMLCCTPFDPLVDTETFQQKRFWKTVFCVAPPSIRLWILKL